MGRISIEGGGGMMWESRSANVCQLLTHWCENGRVSSKDPKAETAQIYAVCNLLAGLSANDRAAFFKRFPSGRMHADLRSRTWAIMNEGKAA